MKVGWYLQDEGTMAVFVDILMPWRVHNQQDRYLQFYQLNPSMRSSSKMVKIKQEHNPNIPQHIHHPQPRYNNNYSPYNSKQRFHVKQDEPIRQSDSQLERQTLIKLRDKRHKNLSVLLQSQKLARNKQKEQTSEIDNNLAYIAQINALQKKKSARGYFLKRKEQFEGSYKIGVLTKKGFEEEVSKVQDSEQTQSTNPGNIENESLNRQQQMGVQQMHFEMVRVQQMAKQLPLK